MKTTLLDNSHKPTFCWDRDWTVGEIKSRLGNATDFERQRLIAWIMREATFDKVWNFISPRDIYPLLDKLLPWLGKNEITGDIRSMSDFDWEKSKALTPLKRDFHAFIYFKSA